LPPAATQKVWVGQEIALISDRSGLNWIGGRQPDAPRRASVDTKRVDRDPPITHTFSLAHPNAVSRAPGATV
jgi:hypothetical protein